MLARPTFIFADENHLSPLLANVLAILAPQLKQDGYNHFYYERSSEHSREHVIKLLQDQIDLSEAGKTLMPQIKQEMLDYLPMPIPEIRGSNLDVSNRNAANFDLLSLHFSNLMKEHKDTPYEFYLGITLGILCAVANHIGKDNMGREQIEKALTSLVGDVKIPTESTEANIRLLQIVHESHMQYKGVDDPAFCRTIEGSNTLSQILNSLQAMQDFPETLEKRNKIMATAYLQSFAPVIGLTGLAHVSGMQQLLTTMIPADIAKANYHFIYVYREPLDETNQAFQAINKIRHDIRTGGVALPMGVILIDGMNKSEEEIAVEVILRINEKIAEHVALPDHLKQIPDISFTGQVRALAGNLFGVFSRAKDSVYQATADAAEKVRSGMHL